MTATSSPAEPPESTLAAVLAEAITEYVGPQKAHSLIPVMRAAILAATPTAAHVAELEAALAAAEARLRAVEAVVRRLSGRYARLCTLHQGDWDDSADDEVEADVLSATLVDLRAALTPPQPAP